MSEENANQEKRKYVVTSAIKDHIKEKGYNSAQDFSDALSDKVELLIDDAIKRAESNQRKTVLVRDL